MIRKLIQSAIVAIWMFIAITIIGCRDSATSKQIAEHTRALDAIQKKLDSVHSLITPHDVAMLREKANQEFNAGNVDVALAYVAAVVAKAPADSGALGLMEQQTGKAVAGVIDGTREKLNDAESLLALLSELNRSAMASAQTVEDVERLLEAEQRMKVLADKLTETRVQASEASTATINKKIIELREKTATAASESEIRALMLKVERTIEAVCDEVPTEEDPDINDTLIAQLQDLGSDLQVKLEEINISAMQKLADQQTERVVNEVVAILDDVEKQRKSISTKKITLQSLGIKLANAEVKTSGGHLMASGVMQERLAATITRLRAETRIIRAEQESSYNDWAIERIKNAAEGYQEGKGKFDDDEGRFLETLHAQLGPINPHYLHPAVSTLFSEIYHKLISELAPIQQIQATEAVESAIKKSLEDF